MSSIGKYFTAVGAAAAVIAMTACHPTQGTSTSNGGAGGSGHGGNADSGGRSGAGGSADGGASGRSGSAGGGGNAAGGTSATSTGGRAGSGGSGVAGGGGGGGGGRGGAGGAGAGGTTALGTGGGGPGGKNGTGGTQSADAGGSDAAADPGSGPTTITGLKIEDNPKNVLSAFVSWTTDKPGNSVVQFGQSKYEWEVSDPALTTTHKVFIIGMYASKAYQIKVLSSNGGTPVSATGTYTTKALPAQIPIPKVSVNDTTQSQPGWTLTNVIKSSSAMGPVSDYPCTAVMYDANGQPVWYHVNGTGKDYGGAISTSLTDKGVMFGPVVYSTGPGESPREVDFAGNTVWECKDPSCGGTGALTHDAIKLSNGNHAIVRWKAIGANTDSETTFEELDASGKVVWTMSFSKLIGGRPSGATGDWCHGNSIVVDIAKDEVYGNCRFFGVVKASYKDPTKLGYYLAASYGKATGTMTFSPTTAQYSDTHHPQPTPDGNLLVFDNGGYASGMSSGTYHSRVLEFKADETKKTATLVWEFPGSFNVDTWYKTKWYTTYYGDADRLPNGNTLITAGSVSSTNGDARIFEVTKDEGKVVWEFRFDSGVGFYRADRITPPLVHAIP